MCLDLELGMSALGRRRRRARHRARRCASWRRLDQLGAALREGNRRVNLTRITDPAEIETRHFLDSLSAAVPLLDRLQQGEALRLVDVGSGGGMPGLPLKIAFPALRVTLVEIVGKKADFLRETVDAAGSERRRGRRRTRRDGRPRSRPSRRVRLGDRARAGHAARRRRVVRAVPGAGRAAGRPAQRRPGRAMLLRAAPAFKALQLWSRTPIELDLPGLAGHGLIVGEKYAPTPEAYPRRPGMPRKQTAAGAE